MEPWVFWNSTRDEWPTTDPADGVVFLAEAMHRLARAQFPDWTGREPWLGAPLVHHHLPASQRHATPAQIRTARDILGGPLRDGIAAISPLTRWERPATPTVALPVINNLPPPPLSDADWELARSRSVEINAFGTKAAQRWADVLEGTFHFFAAGLLKTKLRPVRGGDYEDPPADLWNTELRHARIRFGLCQVDLAHRFNQQSYEEIIGFRIDDAEPQFRRIFVTAASLDDMVRRFETLQAPAGTSERPKLSKAREGEFVELVKGDVKNSPNDYPPGWNRDLYIAHGHDVMHLPMDTAKTAYARALREVAAAGIDHKWSTRRSKK